MGNLTEIESAVDALSPPQQEALFRHLVERLAKGHETRRRLPLVAASGNPISQKEIDDALDAD